MTDQRDKATEGLAREVAEQAAAPPLTRRHLLRGAAIAAPSILTLNTASAALAMSSVRTYTGVASPNQTDGNYYCLADQGTLGPRNGNLNTLQIDGSSMPNLQRIVPRDYQTAPNNGNTSSPIAETDMCRDANKTDGTEYYYQQQGGWGTVRVKGGITLSAAPMTSLGVTATSVDV